MNYDLIDLFTLLNIFFLLASNLLSLLRTIKVFGLIVR